MVDQHRAEAGDHEMTGRGGQRSAVLPDKDLVVVFNSGGVNTDDLAPFLFRAIVRQAAAGKRQRRRVCASGSRR